MRRRQGFLALFAGDTGEIKAEIREQVRAPRTRTIRGCISAALNSCASVDLCRRGARRGWVGAEDTGRADAARDELDAQAVSHLARRQSASTKRPSRAPPSVSPPPLSRTAPSSSPRALASASRVFDLPGGRRRVCSSGRGGGAAQIDTKVSEWREEGKAEIVPGVLFIDEVRRRRCEFPPTQPHTCPTPSRRRRECGQNGDRPYSDAIERKKKGRSSF